MQMQAVELGNSGIVLDRSWAGWAGLAPHPSILHPSAPGWGRVVAPPSRATSRGTALALEGAGC